jgi:hypothetical protein
VSIRLLFCSAKTGDEGEMWGWDENIEEMMMMMKVNIAMGRCHYENHQWKK